MKAREAHGGTSARSVRRWLAIGVLVALALGVLTVVRGGNDPYVLHARFTNAGLLVKGGKVEVAGAQVGTIRRVSLARNGEANIEMAISDERFRPLHRGTRATIRSVGQATITNRYVELGPAPSSSPVLPTGSVLPSTATRGTVDLDAIFNAVDPQMRQRIKGLTRNSAEVFAGSGARDFNAMLRELDPALVPIGDLLGELAADQREITAMVRNGAKAAGALAARHDALGTAVANTATTMAAVAGERQQLSAVLRDAPAVLNTARGTLRQVASTVNDVRPTLRAVAPTQPGLRRLLRRVPVALDSGQQPLRQLSGLIPPLQRALDGLPALETPVRDALDTTASALQKSMPIIEGLRFYSSDIVLGVVNGLLGISAGPYNRYGHYFKVEFLQSAQTGIGGLLSTLVPALTGNSGIVPGLLNMTQDQRQRCPGSNVPPSPDGSSPWYPKAGICDPKQSMSALVNSPTATCRTATDCVGDRRSLEPDPSGLRDLEKAAGR